MLQKEKALEKMCQFTYFFSNMDTIFVDSMNHIKWELGHNKVPTALKPYFSDPIDLLDLYENHSEHTVVFHTSSLRTNYISSEVNDEERNILGTIVTGPYLLEEPGSFFIQDVLFENNLPISLKHILTEYFSSLPIISPYKGKMIAEFLAYHTTKMHLWTLDDSQIEHKTYPAKAENNVPSHQLKENTKQSLDTIEKRYEIQNELMYAVEKGDREIAEKIIREDFALLEKLPDRIPNDPLRSRKNMSFAFNTTLRIAAEKGGLHPVYIDSISEKFAIKIEKTSTLNQISGIETQMVNEYCEAVNKLSLKQYNYKIRKAIEYIRTNISEDLSLNTISAAIDSSPHELSRQFKKQTNKSLTDYINEQRILEAIYLIDNHHLSITDISLMVGFNDVNYFTKVFKKLKGMTPSHYRKGK
ncbi:helix-turn-helix domain-containing protein [Mesobacillus maritimus]|uniref:helix-turn-helix domain-containing protein n=1 Tax=Mesobacillus maritimus TaxID=1643336 RepID=UPI00384EE276